jgi:beta-catenin-like protein 1
MMEDGEMNAVSVVAADASLSQAAIESLVDSHQNIDIPSHINKLQRLIDENIQRRIRHSNEPNKYFESEFQLNNTIKLFQTYNDTPEVYPALAAKNAVSILFQLLVDHNNPLIHATILETLNQLFDEQLVTDKNNEQLIKPLVAEFINNDGVNILLKFLLQIPSKPKKSSNSDDQEAQEQFHYNILALIDVFTLIQPDHIIKIVENDAQHTLILTLIKQITQNNPETKESSEGFSEIVLESSEILAALLQALGHDRIQRIFNSPAVNSEFSCLEKLIEALAVYRNVDPRAAEEKEFVHNLISIICSVIENSSEAIQSQLIELEWTELLILLMKSVVSFISPLTIKLLDYSISENQLLCANFVENHGLKYLFSLFLQKFSFKQGKSAKSQQFTRILSIVCQLFYHLPHNILSLRLLKKFEENYYEKLDYLMELFIEKYNEIQQKTAEILGKSGQSSETLAQTMIYAVQSELGLFDLQLLSVLVVQLYTSSAHNYKKRINLLLNQYDLGVEKSVKPILQQFYDSLSSERAENHRPDRDQLMKARLSQLIQIL